MAKRVGVILSGCGVQDGSEIHEATLTLYFLDRAGAQIIAMAPDKPQRDVVDHTNGSAAAERRNVLTESARIARGDIRDIRRVRVDDLDAVVLPGGYGAAKNLCTFAQDGPACSVDPDVSRLLRDMHERKKPIGALCIAPVIVARLFGPDHHVRVTIGNDAGTASAIEKMGARHVDCPVDDIVVDEENRILTTPCYMLARGPAEVGKGVEKLVGRLLAMA